SKLDETKLVVSLREAGLSGYQAAALLQQRYRIYVEMADWFNLVLCVTIGTTRGDCEILAPALKDLLYREGGRAGIADAPPPLPESAVKRMLPREAWFARLKPVPLEEARGLISGETVAVHPPGVPVLCPGEEVTGEVLDYLNAVRRLKLPCHGPSDPALKYLRAVVE
ncbi:MAG: decarboxylase, partial [Firmicutes bacterium]|nr:decarboxylase [Bacillota bacterium]